MHTLKYYITTTTMFFFAFFLPSAIAEEQGTDGTPSSDAAIEEVVVTARRREESLQDTPVSITAFSSVELESRNMTSLDEVGAYIPNVKMNKSPSSSGGGNNIQIYIRGVGQTDFLFTTDPGVGIYVDGVFHPRTLGGVMDLLDLERVEVLRGPQGTLFGKNTIGGAISLVSQKPTGEGAGYIELTTGRYDRADVRGSYDFSLSDNLAGKISFVSKARDGYGKRLDFVTKETLDTTGDEDMMGARLALAWQPSDVVSVDFVADVTQEREKGMPTNLIYFDDTVAYGGLQGLWNFLVGGPAGEIMSSAFVTDKPHVNYAGGANRNDLDASGYSLTVDWAMNDSVSLKSITAYREMEAAFNSDSDASPIQYVETDQDQDQDQFSQEFQLSGKAFDDKLDWLFGVFYFDEFGRDDNTVRLVSGLYNALEAFPGPLDGSPLSAPTAPGGPGNPINVLLDLDLDVFNEIDITSYAFFTQNTYEFSDKLSVTGGFRYTKEEKDYFLVHLRANAGVPTVPATTVKDEWSAFSPMATLDYRVSDNLLTYFSVSKGFKSGGFNGRPITENQVDSFDPEEVLAYEFGMKSDLLDNRLRLNFSLFFNDYTDLQLGSISADSTGNLVLRIQNAGEAEVQGFELEMMARPVAALDIIASVGYTDFEIKKLDPGVVDVTIDSKQVNTPEWNATLGLQYTWQAFGGEVRFRGDWSYQDETEQDVQNTPMIASDSYTLMSARIVYENMEDGWELALFGTNITDEEYISNGFQALGSFGIADVNYGRPSEWGLTFKKLF